MRRQVRFYASVILLILGSLLISTQRAFAHVELIRVEPADGAVMATSPTSMQLWFNETVVDRFSGVQLVDLQNQPVSGLTIQVDAETHDQLNVTLPTLPPGGYTLFWEALSDVDGHLSQGFTTFTIGAETPVGPAVVASVNGGVSPPGEGLLRWLNYLLLMSVLGALSMLRWVLPPTQATPAAAIAQQNLRRRMLWLAAGSAGGAFLLGFALLLAQVKTTQAATVTVGTQAAPVWILLSQTKWGILWWARQTICLLLTGGLWRVASQSKEPVGAWPWLFIYGRAIDLSIIQALIGHAGSTNHDWLLTVAATTVHLLAAGIWMGGLLTLWLLFSSIGNRRYQARPGWRPIDWRAFMWAASVSVGLLFATGLYRMGQQVASVDALLTTSYGQLLLVKILLVCVVGLCGLANAIVVHPRFAVWLGRHVGFGFIERLGRALRGQSLASARLPRFMLVEVTGGLLILGTVALLTASAPPRSVAYTIAPDDIKPVLGQRVDDLIVTLEAKPNRIGRNLFNVRGVSTIPGAAGPTRVSLNFQYLGGADANKDARALIAKEVEPGIFQLTGNYLAQAGPWQIDVTVQRHDQADSIAHFRWIAPPAGEIEPVLLSKAPWAHALTILAIALLLLLILVVWSFNFYQLSSLSRPCMGSERFIKVKSFRN